MLRPSSSAARTMAAARSRSTAALPQAAGGTCISRFWLRRYWTICRNAPTASSGRPKLGMPAAANAARAAATPSPPIQQPRMFFDEAFAIGATARAICSLGTMAVGAWMNSTASHSGAASRISSART